MCSLHFREVDYEKKSQDTKLSRKEKRDGGLLRRILKKDAVPCLFPNLPSYMSANLPQPRASTSSADERLRRERERELEKEKDQRERDKVKSFAHLLENLPKVDIAKDLVVRKKDNSITFLSLTDDIPIKIEYYLSIDDTLDYHLCANNVLISKKSVRSIASSKIELFSSLAKLLSFLKDASSRKDPTNVLKDFSENLTEYAEKAENETVQKKVLFVAEQLSLAAVPKTARKYSSDLLAASLMWKTTSGALYRQLQEEDCLTLPTSKHLTRMSRSLTTDLGISESTISYLKTRFNTLSEREKLVVLMLDEIYCAERVEYAKGTFYGGGKELTKTMLSFMIKAVAGKYSDIVALFPVRNLDSSKILSNFHSVLTALTDIGFHVIALSVDNATPNRKFYVEELCGGNLTTRIPHPTMTESSLFLLFDAVHNFKNIYNNFVGRKEFIYPAFIQTPPVAKAMFDHIEEMYTLELGKPVKMAYKLNDKVLHPSNIEKTNVQLADSLFHESTIGGLRYYSEHGHPEWADTANFLQVIRNWWNIVNVKGPTVGKRKRNKFMNPVSKDDLTNLEKLKTFAKWFSQWRDNTKSNGMKTGLTDETFLAVIQTTKASIEVAEELLTRDEIEYVLLGNLQSDPIERRFGWYRQLAGGNYFISVRQILEAEKSIRLKSLVKFSRLSMAQVKETFEDGNSNQELVLKQEKDQLLELLEHDCTDFESLQAEDANIVFYVAGCYARSLCKEQKCQSCVQLLKKNDDVPSVSFEQDENDKYASEKQQFLDQVNRGGLCYPSDLTYVTCLHAWKFYHDIQSQKEAYQLMLSSIAPQKVFVSAFIDTCSESSNTQDILTQQCENGHIFQKLFGRLAVKMFNTFAKNMCAEKNSSIHKGKKRSSTSKDGRKIKKLQSNPV